MDLKLYIRDTSINSSMKVLPTSQITKQNENLGQFTHIAFFCIMFIGMFNGMLEKFLSTFVVSLISLLITLSLICLKKDNVKSDYYLILCVGIITTILSYLLFAFNLHYDISTTVKNTIITTMNAMRNVLLFIFFFQKKMDKNIVRITMFFLIIEILTYLLFLIFKTKGGNLEYTLMRLNLLRDWQGRFKGTFGEPMCMGFYLGVIIFFVLINYNSKWKYIVAFVLTYILITACKAKLAVVAFPIAFFAPFFAEKIWKINMGKLIFGILFVFFCVFIAIAWFDPYIIFSFIARNFGNNASYGTRFCFLVASLRQVVLYPLGTGYGLNFEYYYKALESLLPILEASGLDSVELRYALIEGHQNGMNGKETISHLICCYGIPGIIGYIKIFAKYYRMNFMHKKFIRGLMFFTLIESMFTINIFMEYCIPFVLVIIMLMNTYEIKENQVPI